MTEEEKYEQIEKLIHRFDLKDRERRIISEELLLKAHDLLRKEGNLNISGYDLAARFEELHFSHRRDDVSFGKTEVYTLIDHLVDQGLFKSELIHDENGKSIKTYHRIINEEEADS